jgi:hypothetical protein
MNKYALLALCALLGGCASSIMKSYLGKTIADAVMDYGPPITAFDMGQGRRAFIWTMNSSYTMPGSTTTTGNLNVIGGTGFYSATTIASPPQTFNQQCNYTIFAERIPGAPEGPAGWRVVDFRKPNLMCE